MKTKEERINEFDQASFVGKHQAPYVPNEKNYNGVDPKLRFAKIYKPSPTKPQEKVNLSPTSYHMSESFIKSQLPAPKFYISKYKYTNFIEKQEKNTKWTPGSGAYNQGIPDCITKGAAKGWK